MAYVIEKKREKTKRERKQKEKFYYINEKLLKVAMTFELKNFYKYFT